MSQISKQGSGGSTPGTITFITDVNPSAVPSGGNLNVIGGSSGTFHESGVYTDGSSGANTLIVFLSNRIHGRVITTDATVTPIATFATVGPGVYAIKVLVSAWNPVDGVGATYDVFAGIKYVGAVGTKLGAEFKNVIEDTAMGTCNVTVTVSALNILINATGIAGKTIKWTATGTYEFEGT